jgi:hypothetical protein
MDEKIQKISFLLFKEGKIYECKIPHIPKNAKIYKYNII